VNVEGTRRALELSRAMGAEWFVYVSTAYTAGKQRGAIALEVPGVQVEHNNYYEASKAEAERLVVEFCARHGLRYAILRPSIVIGPYSSKSTGGSSTGLYGFVREIARARAALCKLGRPLELRGEPSTELNLLPIDWFIEDVDDLLRDEPQASCVHHHTLDASPTIGDIGQALTELLGVPGFAISPAFEAPGSPLEQLLERRTAFYGAYLTGTKRFQRARPFPKQLTPDDVREYVAAALGRSEPLGRLVPIVEPERRSRVGR
jgi:nucleoside-diphosphate-sugar epimerase